MAKKKISYTVSYVVRDWIDVEVKADTEEEAKKAAQRCMDESGYASKSINVIDGNTNYIGIRNDDVFKLLGD